MKVALVHDYLTQLGGAERVALSLARAFPGAPLYTSLYEPEETFPEFRDVDVRPSWLNRQPRLRRDHRLALPFYAPTMARLPVDDADLVIASSSGWAHGVRTRARVLVYCHAPARWLYQPNQYLGRDSSRAARAALATLGPVLREWDRRSACRAAGYLCNSRAVRDAIWAIYGIEARIVPPPPAVRSDGPEEPVPGLERGYLLVVSRLMPYKNVDVAIAAAEATGNRLVVVGSGPLEGALRAQATPRITMLNRVRDEQLRWLYRNARLVLAPSFEDFGLTPLEANTFGVPVVSLRSGGYLDTVDEGVSGLFADAANPDSFAKAIVEADNTTWDVEAIRAHAEKFSEERFVERIRAEAVRCHDQPR